MKLFGLDRAAIVAFAGINAMVLMLILIGDRSRPQVREFSWHNQQIGQSDLVFELTFDRPVDQASVSQNLTIDPPMAGDISWRGRKMLYRLTSPPQYGQQAKLTLQDVTYQDNPRSKKSRPFTGTFQTRDRVIAYVGLEDEERGRVVLKNLTTDFTQLLTPEDLTVTDFKIIQNGAQILFSAFSFDPTSENLFAVNTGLGAGLNDEELLAPGRLFNLLMDGDYIQSRFVASNDGKTMVIYRQSRQDPQDRQLWAQVDGKPWQPLGLDTQNFHLSPDGRAIAFIENDGLTLAKLNDQGQIEQPRLFFPNYVEVLGFSPDSKRLALLKYKPELNQNTLMIFDGETEKAIVQTAPLLECKFEPLTENYLYCLQVEITTDGTQPALMIVDIQEQQASPLIYIPRYDNLRMSMVQDGSNLLFDQTAVALEEKDGVINHNGQAIAAGLIWSLPLPEPKKLDVKELEEINPVKVASGMNPRSVP